MNQFQNYNDHTRTETQYVVGNPVSQVMKRVYLKMFLGMLVTAFVSMWGASSAAYLNFMFSHS